MKKNNQKTPTAAILFNVFSVIFLVFFAFNIYYSYDYLNQLGAQVSYSEDWAAVLSIYSGQCIPSLVGAMACYGIGFIIVKLQNTQNVLLECIEDAVSEDEDFEVKPIVKKEEVKEEIKEEVKEEVKELIESEEQKVKDTVEAKIDEVKEVVLEETKENEKA